MGIETETEAEINGIGSRIEKYVKKGVGVWFQIDEGIRGLGKSKGRLSKEGGRS